MPRKNGRNLTSTEDSLDLDEKIFHLARVALRGSPRDVALLVRKYARGLRSDSPQLAERLVELLRENPVRGDVLRSAEPAGLPVDTDTRVPLIRFLEAPTLEFEPVYGEGTWRVLRRLVRERLHTERLAAAGVDPTRSVLFTGLPGVGKTLAAHWISREMERPLAILDLSAVMSSFLGRTGNNLRVVLDFARERECVLLLDELDAVAKRRDDTSEIGELKRLVTVLLQEIDDWPPTGLLLAATNHPRLLDPAAWRRFEAVVEFPLPEIEELEAVLRDVLDLAEESVWPAVLGRALEGLSFSDVVRIAFQARRSAALEGVPVEDSLVSTLHEIRDSLPRRRRQQFAVSLVEEGIVSQRRATAMTGVSRDTIRKHARTAAG